MAIPAPEWLRYFRFLLWNRWAQFAETWKEARTQWPLTSSCFRADRKPRWPPGLWLAYIFSTSFLKPQNRICRNLTLKKQDGQPFETFTTIPLEPQNRIWWNLWRGKYSMPSSEFPRQSIHVQFSRFTKFTRRPSVFYTFISSMSVVNFRKLL